MQDIKQTQMTQPRDEATNAQTAWMPPKIKVYDENNLLKTVTVFGCSLQAE